jgi:hypothetical protein
MRTLIWGSTFVRNVQVSQKTIFSCPASSFLASGGYKRIDYTRPHAAGGTPVQVAAQGVYEHLCNTNDQEKS